MCVMSPSAGTGAGGLHVELCVPNENQRAYSVSAAFFSFSLRLPLFRDIPSLLGLNVRMDFSQTAIHFFPHFLYASFFHYMSLDILTSLLGLM
jgi:hypothetical protein